MHLTPPTCAINLVAIWKEGLTTENTESTEENLELKNVPLLSLTPAFKIT